MGDVNLIPLLFEKSMWSECIGIGSAGKWPPCSWNLFELKVESMKCRVVCMKHCTVHYFFRFKQRHRSPIRCSSAFLYYQFPQQHDKAVRTILILECINFTCVCVDAVTQA